jgi:hypothetical protein
MTRRRGGGGGGGGGEQSAAAVVRGGRPPKGSYICSLSWWTRCAQTLAACSRHTAAAPMASRRAICCWLEVRHCLPAAYACGRHLHLCPRKLVLRQLRHRALLRAGMSAPRLGAPQGAMQGHPRGRPALKTKIIDDAPDKSCSLHHAPCCAVSSLRRCTLRNAPFSSALLGASTTTQPPHTGAP